MYWSASTHAPYAGPIFTRWTEICLIQNSRSYQDTKSLDVLQPPESTPSDSKPATAWAFHGWHGPAAVANTADQAKRISVIPRDSPATPGTAVMPNSPLLMSVFASPFQTRMVMLRLPRCCVRD